MDGKPPGSFRSKLIKIAKIAVPIGLVAGIAIQFIPVKGIGDNPTERHTLEAPPEVAAILRESCFDCHSNETEWPWYARIAPSSWLMARDVRKGRSHMNFSEWGDSDEDARAIDKENSWDEIEEGEMPPWFYLPMHPSARMTDEKKAILKKWLLAKAPAKAEEKAEKPAEPPK